METFAAPSRFRLHQMVFTSVQAPTTSIMSSLFTSRNSTLNAPGQAPSGIKEYALPLKYGWSVGRVLVVVDGDCEALVVVLVGSTLTPRLRAQRATPVLASLHTTSGKPSSVTSWHATYWKPPLASSKMVPGVELKWDAESLPTFAYQ